MTTKLQTGQNINSPQYRLPKRALLRKTASAATTTCSLASSGTDEAVRVRNYLTRREASRVNFTVRAEVCKLSAHVEEVDRNTDSSLPRMRDTEGKGLHDGSRFVGIQR